MSAAEELCKRALKRDKNKVTQCWNRNDEKKEDSKKDIERKESVMEERDQLRKWDPGWENQKECRLWATPIWL